MDPATSGPVVYENMETSAEGIFASGNVVHVHDLVDFVTAESQKAGKECCKIRKKWRNKRSDMHRYQKWRWGQRNRATESTSI